MSEGSSGDAGTAPAPALLSLLLSSLFLLRHVNALAGGGGGGGVVVVAEGLSLEGGAARQLHLRHLHTHARMQAERGGGGGGKRRRRRLAAGGEAESKTEGSWHLEAEKHVTPTCRQRRRGKSARAQEGEGGAEGGAETMRAARRLERYKAVSTRALRSSSSRPLTSSSWRVSTKVPASSSSLST